MGNSEMDIKWEDAPDNSLVWVQDINPDCGNDLSGWFQEMDDKYVEWGSRNFILKADECYAVHRRHVADPVSAPAEFVPTVGEECEFNYSPLSDGSEWVRCFIVGNVKDGRRAFQEITSHGVKGVKVAGSLGMFRPLKTEEEKAREAFIEDCFNATPLGKTDVYVEMFGNMFDLGFTAPKGDE